VRQVRSRGILVLPIAAPDAWEWDGVRFTVHHPPAGWRPDASDNARSVVLDVAHDGHHLLLTGDLEQMGLVELVAQPRLDPPPEVMLAPHHGGRTANPGWLYQWARPRAVVVSQRQPHPGSTDALSPLEQQGIPLWRTWREGSIRFRWTGDGIVARGFLEESDARVEPPGSSRASDPPRSIPHSPLAAWFSPGIVRIAAGLAGFALGVILWAVLAVVEFGAWVLVVPPRSIRHRSEAVDYPTT
jgi:competence protein ComEC